MPFVSVFILNTERQRDTVKSAEMQGKDGTFYLDIMKRSFSLTDEGRCEAVIMSRPEDLEGLQASSCPQSEDSKGICSQKWSPIAKYKFPRKKVSS